MYASVGSYLARVSRILDMRYTRFPNRFATAVLAILIYLNFFTHHYLPDIRILLFAAVGVLFGPTWVYFRCYRRYRRMPLVAGFGLVALFIWFGETSDIYCRVGLSKPEKRLGGGAFWQIRLMAVADDYQFYPGVSCPPAYAAAR